MQENDRDELDFKLWSELRDATLDQLHRELESDSRDRRYAAARILHSSGEKSTLQIALKLANSPSSDQREVAAFVMGQLPGLDLYSRNIVINILSDMLEGDSQGLVRSSAASALGHLNAVEKLQALSAGALDQEKDVRASVAFAAGQIDTPETAKLLIDLSHDQDREVAEWAALGLANGSNVSNNLIRKRLAELTEHSSREVRETAITALAKLGDTSVVPALLSALEDNDVSLSVVDAAGQLGDRRALPLLIDMVRGCQGNVPSVLLDSIEKLGATK
ncbi:Protein YibA [Xanthomonas hortorum pv. pelargonii]|uniref:Protein YibA n=3 Tax=Xanthomonas hortorum TaxID=56454 RepID=A0A6V7D6P5_9XANT|nr:Protein YibA [Xanthomonas hortorum pv. pelargonii]CAD0328565.1 Protein YibA [Xanthomonas hortorum pv. pelargonii]